MRIPLQRFHPSRDLHRLVAIASALLAFAVAACTAPSTATRADAADTVRASGRVSTISGFTEFYRLMRYNALGQIVFCHPTNDPKSEPSIYAVARDLNGRPVTIGRYFFGNPDNQAEWVRMKIEYRFFASTATLVERRTYHDAFGAPREVRGAHGQELLIKGGILTMRRLIDKEGKPLQGVPIVVRSFFKEERPGTHIQEWFFGNGKQYYGAGTDDPGMPFGDMPPQAYFRRFTVDQKGELIREEVWGIDKKAMPYPGGEIVRAYELNACGQPEQIAYLDESGRSQPNADGIARETMRYDDAGRLVEWQAFGESGTPRARSFDGAAAAVYRYRPFDGQLIAVERFDAAGDALAPDSVRAVERRE